MSGRASRAPEPQRAVPALTWAARCPCPLRKVGTLETDKLLQNIRVEPRMIPHGVDSVVLTIGEDFTRSFTCAELDTLSGFIFEAASRGTLHAAALRQGNYELSETLTQLAMNSLLQTNGLAVYYVLTTAAPGTLIIMQDISDRRHPDLLRIDADEATVVSTALHGSSSGLEWKLAYHRHHAARGTSERELKLLIDDLAKSPKN